MIVPKIHMAPMMGWTDRHFRYLLRRICPSVLLYTEMITTGALIYGQRLHLLDHDVSEHPLLVQLGGCDPYHLYRCALLAHDRGYTGVNLNVGCPSSRVQAGNMGAALFKDKNRLVGCVAAIVRSGLPVSVKLRIGVDDCDDLSYLIDVVKSIKDAGCQFVQIHARKAWLKGLNPRQNRTVPPLNYARVLELADALGNFPIVLNGGLVCLDRCEAFLQQFSGVMIGRKACEDPWFLRDLHHRIVGNEGLMSKVDVLKNYLDYSQKQIAAGVRPSQVIKPLYTLMKGCRNAKKYRTTLMTLSRAEPATITASLPNIRQELIHYIDLGDKHYV